MTTTVVLLGTLDTKGAEYDYFRRSVTQNGAHVVLIDAGIGEPNGAVPDIDHHQVAEEGGSSIDALRAAGNRADALRVMATGAARILSRLRSEERLDAVAGLGGTGGSTLISQAMRALAIGVPKLLVSTVASGDTRPYVGDTDITLMNSIVDIAGINRISGTIIGNAAAAIAGMAKAEAPEDSGGKTVIGATMFGLTTPCVTVAREYLEERDYEVLVFHATGSGGQALESLIDAGLVDAMLDVTTTELADNLVGGVFSAGPDRLTAAGRAGIPQVVSVGALDMVNFGAESTIPSKFRDRTFHRHNDTVTLMRTTPDENVALGREIAEKLNAATGPAALFFPMKGVSGIAVEGGAFHSPAADAALFDALRDNLSDEVPLTVVDSDINDPVFGLAMAARLHELIQQRTTQHENEERTR